MPQAQPDAKVKFDDDLAYYEANIFPLEVKDVIFLDDSARHHETFIGQLEKFVSESSMVTEFEVIPAVVGSYWYTSYGEGTYVVIKKTLP